MTRESWKESPRRLAPGFSQRVVSRRFTSGRLFQPLLIPQIRTETEEKQSFLPDFEAFVRDPGLRSPQTLATIKLGLFGCFLFSEKAVSGQGGFGFSLFAAYLRTRKRAALWDSAALFQSASATEGTLLQRKTAKPFSSPPQNIYYSSRAAHV